MATDLQIRFCTMADGARIAYSTVGDGPALVWPPGWISHLERQWAQPTFRTFVETLGRRHTVVLFDRYGSGLSDRDRTEFTIAADVRVLEAVVDHLQLDRFALLSISAGGPYAIAYAAAHPQRVSQLILFGTRARVDAATFALREAMNALIEADWGIGSRTLADVFIPDADAATNAWFAAWQREAATAEMAIQLRRMSTRTDVADLAARLRLPVLVIHRRGDLVVPVEHGRDLAALIPNARFVLLDGQDHLPYFGDAAAILRVIAEFLGDPVEPSTSDRADQPVGRDPSPSEPRRALPGPTAGVDLRAEEPALSAADLTGREATVLQRIAAGRTNKEIAAELHISVATVERHIVNLYAKIGARNRADATAHAFRHSLAAFHQP